MTENEEMQSGHALAVLLKLRAAPGFADGGMELRRYPTQNGTKTALGLWRTVDQYVRTVKRQLHEGNLDE